jgi:hypothetical protein
MLALTTPRIVVRTAVALDSILVAGQAGSGAAAMSHARHEARESAMPESYEIDQTHELVISRAWESLNDRELRSHYYRLEADRRFNPAYRQLIDVRDVQHFTLTSAVMLGTALAHVFRSGVQRAIVVANDEQFGLARIFAAYSEADGQCVQIFREAGAARAWLGL